MLHGLEELIQHEATRHDDGSSRWELPWNLDAHFDEIEQSVQVAMTQLVWKSELAHCTPRPELDGRQVQTVLRNWCWCWPNVLQDGRRCVKNCWCQRNVFHAWSRDGVNCKCRRDVIPFRLPLTRRHFVPTRTKRGRKVHNRQP